MNEGVHGGVHVADPSIYQVLEVSKETTIESVPRLVGATGDTAAVELTAPSSAAIDDADEMFHYEQKMIYRVTYSFTEESRYACELIEGHGCPVRHLETDCGAITPPFVAADLESSHDIIVNLKSAFDGVSLRRFIQSEPDSATGSLVFVDHSKLMVRQWEVLETAHEMGYLEHPREASAMGVAAAPDINHSMFTERLPAAQSKLLDTILDV